MLYIRSYQAKGYNNYCQNTTCSQHGWGGIVKMFSFLLYMFYQNVRVVAFVWKHALNLMIDQNLLVLLLFHKQDFLTLILYLLFLYVFLNFTFYSDLFNCSIRISFVKRLIIFFYKVKKYGNYVPR